MAPVSAATARKVKSQSGEHAGIGGVHGLIGIDQAVAAGVEGIGVLHQELARAHDAEARADFVAEFHLDLIKADGQLPIAFDFAARDVGDDFLVGGAEAEIALVAILDLEHLRAEHRPAPGFFPQFRGLDCGHQEFDRAGAVHFLAYHRLDPAQHPQAQRHPGIQARSQTLDESGAQHQLVADEFGVGRGFLGGGNEKLAGAHGEGRRQNDEGRHFTAWAEDCSGKSPTGG